MAIDIAEDVAPKVADPEKIALAIDSARKLMRMEMEIERLEGQLDALKKEHEILSTDSLPSLLEQIGVPTLTLGNGYSLKVESIFKASLPAKGAIEKAKDEERDALVRRLNEGLKWLRRQKASDLIRQTIRFDLGKGTEKQAAEIMMLAKRLKINGDRSETVHPASLSKLLQEKLAAGIAVPLDTFGIFDGKRAKIVAPKVQKG